ncbi:N-acetyl-1-D-myo-inositol-2-amino-2-deoxy-alpha-D-glucopyranoside deacetylase [Pseudonocardia sp.]|uniref:N-acetyl-1-D-myo-inositol-2-amino-2-deoxy-alpha- D-glucopyranoside deacetylase n=1 Tax=Pseudonocardia sp. TaxID=60912 RepID=UPI003D0C4923
MTTRTARRVLFVHAHPDDESLATGGTIARYAADPTTSVTLVTCTLGEEGDVIPPELAHLAAGEADQLGGYRIAELAAACAALGPVDQRYLGGAGRWRDTGMALAGHGIRAALPSTLHPRAFASPEAFDAQVTALREILDEVRPQVVVSYDAAGGYGHPDHVRAHDVTAAAVAACPHVRKRYACVRGRAQLDAGLAALATVADLPFRLPGPDELPSVDDALITTRVEVSAFHGHQLAAIRAHVTQAWAHDGPPPSYAVSNGVAQPMPDDEEYVLLDAPPGGPPETDLFAGVA